MTEEEEEYFPVPKYYISGSSPVPVPLNKLHRRLSCAVGCQLKQVWDHTSYLKILSPLETHGYNTIITRKRNFPDSS